MGLTVLLPLIPGLIDVVLKLISAVRSDPATAAEDHARLDALSAKLTQVVEDVKQVRLPS